MVHHILCSFQRLILGTGSSRFRFFFFYSFEGFHSLSSTFTITAQCSKTFMLHTNFQVRMICRHIRTTAAQKTPATDFLKSYTWLLVHNFVAIHQLSRNQKCKCRYQLFSTLTHQVPLLSTHTSTEMPDD